VPDHNIRKLAALDLLDGRIPSAFINRSKPHVPVLAEIAPPIPSMIRPAASLQL